MVVFSCTKSMLLSRVYKHQVVPCRLFFILFAFCSHLAAPTKQLVYRLMHAVCLTRAMWTLKLLEWILIILQREGLSGKKLRILLQKKNILRSGIFFSSAGRVLDTEIPARASICIFSHRLGYADEGRRVSESITANLFSAVARESICSSTSAARLARAERPHEFPTWAAVFSFEPSTTARMATSFARARVLCIIIMPVGSLNVFVLFEREITSFTPVFGCKTWNKIQWKRITTPS